jgi:hypothetical protein
MAARLPRRGDLTPRLGHRLDQPSRLLRLGLAGRGGGGRDVLIEQAVDIVRQRPAVVFGQLFEHLLGVGVDSKRD